MRRRLPRSLGAGQQAHRKRRIPLPSTLNSTVGYERSFTYGNAVEIYGEIGNHWKSGPINSGKDITGTAA